MPRTNCDEKSRERYISRFLANKLIDPVSVIGGFIPELMEMAESNGKVVVLSLDQSITKTHLKHAIRIERLILILTIALYWAVSTGMKPRISVQTKKNR